MVEFRLLGEVVAHVGGRAVDLGPARQRCVWAALAVDVNRVVSLDRLIERVWGEDPPQRARATLSSYVSRLRQALADTDTDTTTLARRSGGYVLRADESLVDLHRFRALHARARASAGDDDHRTAELLAEALGLWRGEALSGLDGNWAGCERDRLNRERLDAECDLTDALLRLGHGEDLVATLAARAVEHPLDERVAGQYMLALHRGGRASQALEHYRRLRQLLVDEVGTEPGAALRRLHRQVLDDDPVLAGTDRGPAEDGHALAPRQLPARPAPFVGRGDELTALDDATGTVVISAVAGTGGIGKTWLTLHWAHHNLHRFPDGQLFVDLRGFGPDGDPMPSAVVLRGFLEALQVAPGRIPVDEHAQAALFRSLLADKRMLLVLDNAADTAQVVPLLPGGASCTVLVTSRTRLSGLITGHGARHLSLDVLTDDEARALLANRLGGARVAAEPAAVDRVIGFCQGFPLALSIVAGHAHSRPRLTLAALATELHDLGLGALDDDDPTASLPTVLSWSHDALTDEQARVFALLGIAPGPDIGVPAAAVLAGLPPVRTATVLRALEQASLISRDAHGRYRMHDLVRRYAVDTAGRLADAERHAALERVVDFHLHTAHAADRLLDPHRRPITLHPPAPGRDPRPLSDDKAALAWFDAEHLCLLAARDTAAAHGRHEVAWQLAWTLRTFHYRRGHLHDQLVLWQHAAAAVDHLADGAARTLTHRYLGEAFAESGMLDEALDHLHRALALVEHVDDLRLHAEVHLALSWLWAQRADDRKALEHTTHALDLYHRLDDPVGRARALNDVGWFAARLGDHDEAREHCLAALALHREHHNRVGEAAALDSLGFIDHATGRHTRAADRYRQALDLFRELGHTYQQAETLDRLGHPLAALGEHGRARAAWREALRLYRAQQRAEDADRVRRQLDTLDP